MRKQRPIRTGTARASKRKGKKLQGLTPFEARQRALRGWATKRAHGFHSLHSEEDDDQVFRRKRPRLQEERVRQAELSEMSWKDRQDWEARQFRHGEPFSKEFRDVLDGLPRKEREAFLTRIRAQEERDRQLGRIERDQDPYTESHTEPGSILRRTGRQRLEAVINKDSKTRGRIVELKADDQYSEVHYHDEVDEHGNTVRVASKRVIAVAKDPDATKAATPEEVRQAAHQALWDTFAGPDPVHPENERILIPPERIKAFETLVVKSHFATTEAERSRAAKLAQNLAGQMTQAAARKQAARVETRRVADIDKELSQQAVRPTVRPQLSQVAKLANDLGITAQTQEGMKRLPNARSQAKFLREELEARSPEVVKMELRRVQLVQRQRQLEGELRDESKRTKGRRSRASRPKLAELKQNKAEQKQIQTEVARHHNTIQQLRRIEADREDRLAQAQAITAAGMNPYASLPRERRLGGTTHGDFTVEDLYNAYGHETAPAFGHIRANLTKHQKLKLLAQERDKRLAEAHSEAYKGLIHTQHDRAAQRVREETPATFASYEDVPIEQREDLPFSRVRTQLAFNKGQARTKRRALKEGTYTAGWDKQGRRVSDLDKATFRVSPNQRWHYELRDPDNPLVPKHQELPYWDTKTKHKVGRRNLQGHLLPDEYDEMQREVAVPRYTDQFNLALGKQGRLDTKTAPTLSEQESEEVIIPMHGVRTSTRREKDPNPEATYQQKVIRVNGRWVPASDEEYAQAEANNRETQAFRKTRLVTFMDPSQVALRSGERDELSFVTKGRVFDVNAAELGTLGRGLHRYADAKRIVDARNTAENQAWERSHRLGFVPKTLDTQGNPSHPHYALHRMGYDPNTGEAGYKEKPAALREIAAAGGYAAYYGTRKRVRSGYLPRAINTTYAGLQTHVPGFGKWAERKGIAKATVGKAEVIEELTRPAISRAATLGWQLKHPLSDPTGSTLGIEWGNLYRGEGKFGQWIPMSPETRRHRRVQKLTGEVERVLQTEDYIARNQYRRGVRGAIARHRSEPLQRWKPYAQFYQNSITPIGEGKLSEQNPGLLERALRESRDIKRSTSTTEKAFHEATHLEQRLLDARARHQGLVREGGRVLKREDAWKGSLLPVPYQHHRRFNLEEITPSQKTLLIGGAVAASALGAHYLYHRHQEKKRHAEDPTYRGTAYYNKLLPGPINVPAPRIRTTGRYRIPTNNLTYEFGVANKNPSVRWGISMGEKTIWKGSPADRGYDPNLPILGRPKALAPTKGGSKLDSLFFDQASSGIRRRSYQPEGGQLVIAGRKLPIQVNIGARKRIQLSNTNPNRLSLQDREDIAWAFKGTEHEADIRNFFNSGDRIHNFLDSESEMRRIRKRHGEEKLSTFEGRAFEVPSKDRTEGGRKLVRRSMSRVERPYYSYVGSSDEYEPTEAEKRAEYDKFFFQSHEPGFRSERRAAMATGGTTGVDPYSQIGQPRTRADERFAGWEEETVKPRPRKRATGPKGEELGDPEGSSTEPARAGGTRRKPVFEQFKRGVGTTRGGRKLPPEEVTRVQPYNPKKPPNSKKDRERHKGEK